MVCSPELVFRELVQRKISAIIEETLRLVRDHGLKLVAVEVSQLVHEAVEELAGVADAQKIEIRIERATGSDHVLVDRELVVVALVDIIRNAIEAIGQEGRVVIRVESDVELRSVRVVVADSGPGIPDEVLARVSEPHFGTKPHTTGLGLSIVKNIVENHGGVLSIEANRDGPTEVAFTLPAYLSPKPAD